ncbi:ferritin-like domain-containing protein [Sphingomicrobium sp. XHP0235]|uniref:YciE/YciF ferroxidase family protein n=1 Tax=Sphingomicrobium aquimarinum TaxID=3133971 RepID=UPI0031FEC4F5
MSAPKNLEDCLVHELKDNWSANDQMRRILVDMAHAASDAKLKERLQETIDGIPDNNDVIENILSDMGQSGKEHCKGMEGLVAEAKKHAIDADISDTDVRDVIIVAQYQRMAHYGICGFGTAKAFAEALGKSDVAAKLDELTASIYRADENMTDLAERSVNLQAKQGADA